MLDPIQGDCPGHIDYKFYGYREREYGYFSQLQRFCQL